MNSVQICLLLAGYLMLANCYVTATKQPYSTSTASQEADTIDGVIQAMSGKVLQRDQASSGRAFRHLAGRRHHNNNKNLLSELDKIKTAEQFIRFIVTLVVPDVLKTLLNDKQFLKKLGLRRKLSSWTSEKVPPSGVEKAVAKWRAEKKQKLKQKSKVGDQKDAPMKSLEGANTKKKAVEQVKESSSPIKKLAVGEQVKRLDGNKSSEQKQKQSSND